MRSAADQGGAHFVVHLYQNITFKFRIRHFPHSKALRGRKGFQQVGDFRARKVCQQVANLVLGTRIKRLGQVVEVTRCFVFVILFCHNALLPTAARIIRENGFCFAVRDQNPAYAA